jgi:hypothetical protein
VAIEIKELVIRAVVDAGVGAERAPRGDDEAQAERHAIVQACVKEVLRALARSKQR